MIKVNQTIIRIGLLCLLIATVSSCSNTSNKKDDVIGKAYDVAGYYEGNLNVTRINKFSPSTETNYPAQSQTILIAPTDELDIYTIMISNFEWQDLESRNISFDAVIKIDAIKQTATIKADLTKANNTIIEHSSMELTGKITGKSITMDAVFNTDEADGYDYEVSYAGEASTGVFSSYMFDFEQWYNEKTLLSTHMFSLPEPVQEINWASTDYVVSIWRDINLAQSNTVTAADRGLDGKALSVKTIATEGAAPYKYPKVYGGWLYSGSFDVASFKPDELRESMRVGVDFPKEPLSIKGYYTYVPGEEYYVCPDPNSPNDVQIDEEGKDALGIWMFLYESESDETLSFLEVFTSEKVVGSAHFTSDVPKKEFEAFEAKFEYQEGKVYDADKKYKLAILITSSKESLTYSGAVGSELIIDNLQIMTKE